jgi:tubulin--tyrosine ligase
MAFEVPHANPSTHLTSSYVYRKALIRKHQLHTTFLEYLAKSRHRGRPTILEEAAPRGWTVEIRFADELDEALVDELGELAVDLQANKELEERDRQ